MRMYNRKTKISWNKSILLMGRREKDTVKFGELLHSYESQASEKECSHDWIDYFHMTVRDYFKECEDSSKRPSIKGLKQEVINLAESEMFRFKCSEN